MFARVIGGGPGGISDEEPDMQGEGLPEVSGDNANNEEVGELAEVAEVRAPQNPDEEVVQVVARRGEGNEIVINDLEPAVVAVPQMAQENEGQVAIMGSSFNEQ